MIIKSKKHLAILLSDIKGFSKPKVMLEQYITPSETAADMLWTAYQNNDIYHKNVVDFGSGTGMLGIGAAVLGGFVMGIETDPELIQTCVKNKNMIESKIKMVLNISFITNMIQKINTSADTVIMNPPFGTKEKHIDQVFLLKAFETASRVYSLHKIETKEFINKLARDNKFKPELIKTYNLPLKYSMSHHKKEVVKVKVGFWKFSKNIKE